MNEEMNSQNADQLDYFRTQVVDYTHFVFKEESVQEIEYRKLEKAIIEGDIKTVEDLIHEGIDINHIVKHINEAGRPVYYPVIRQAIDIHNYQITEMLLRAGAKVDLCWNMAKSGGDAYKTNVLGATIQKCTFMNMPLNILKLVLDYGANTEAVQILDSDGEVRAIPALLDAIQTAGEYAESEEDYSYCFKMIDLLIEHGANANQKILSPGQSIPLLFFALNYQNKRLIEKLLSVGASWDTEILTVDHSACPLRKYPLNNEISDSEFLRFLKKKGWKGEGLFGWRG